jgi:hypothetical protein
MAQVVETLPSMIKDLGSIPHTTKKKKKETLKAFFQMLPP